MVEDVTVNRPALGAAVPGEWFGRRQPHGSDPARSRGRLHPEPPSPTRTEFQRDRDRIVHSTAFRRLQYKTQVFVFHEGDYYRTRLTHTLEVAQLSRALARSLGLDEDLAEAVALAHDLGHPPFGHAGERALDRAMAGFGGFDHNAQSLRVVTLLERRYAEFDGLNLSWETIEGIVKHNGPLVDAAGKGIGAYADGVPASIRQQDARHQLRLDSWAGLEAQAAALADDIAYNSHDMDDGLRAGLFGLDDVVGEVPFVAAIVSDLRGRYLGLETSRLIHETTRRVITGLMERALAESAARITAAAPADADAVRAASSAMIAFDATAAAAVTDLRRFLFARMYRHERVNRIMDDAAGAVTRLFEAFLASPERMPPEWARAAARGDLDNHARVVADYIAGMTDRYALSEHRRLFDGAPELR